MPGTARRSARIIILNQEGCVLLIRFDITREGKPFIFWATPGGTVESGESDIEAAKRELLEELKLDIPIEGPVHSALSEYEHEGVQVSNTDVFFAGTCNQEVLSIHGVTASESAAMQEIKWWSAMEIEQSDEIFFPPDLAIVIRKLLSK